MAICEAAQLRTSTTIKLCIEYVLNHPEAWGIFQRVAPCICIDNRSPEAVAAFEQYMEKMAAFDMQAVARENGLA
jgi:hypothetical protein